MQRAQLYLESRAAHEEATPSTFQALLSMTRPRTLPMSAMLLAIGAYGAERSWGFMYNRVIQGQLVLVALLVMATTGASMMVNDYFDFYDGVDALKAGKRPLVLEHVTPTTVKAACKYLYGIHLALLLFVRHSSLRFCIYANTLATYLYTRHFKPIVGVKNFICAGVIATTVALGAAVVKGTMVGGLASVWPLVTTVGLGIFHREVMMDVVDLEGDLAAGVRTIPAVFGRCGAIGIATIPLVAAIVVLNRSWAHGVVRWPLASSAPLLVMCMLAARAAKDVANAPENSPRSLEAVVESAPILLFVSLVISLQ